VMLGQSSSLTEQQQILCMGLMLILTLHPSARPFPMGPAVEQKRPCGETLAMSL
jgi:hypothetical protein